MSLFYLVSDMYNKLKVKNLTFSLSNLDVLDESDTDVKVFVNTCDQGTFDLVFAKIEQTLTEMFETATMFTFTEPFDVSKTAINEDIYTIHLNSFVQTQTDPEKAYVKVRVSFGTDDWIMFIDRFLKYVSASHNFSERDTQSRIQNIDSKLTNFVSTLRMPVEWCVDETASTVDISIPQIRKRTLVDLF